MTGENNDAPPPALFVCFNIKARREDGQHVANLLCVEPAECDEQKGLGGESRVE